MRFQMTAAAILVLASGCQGNKQALFTTDASVQGFFPDDATLAFFGAAEVDDVVRMLVVATDNPGLCDAVDPELAVESFLADIGGGDIEGLHVVTFVESSGTLEVGEVFEGEAGAEEIVDPQFLVSNGTELAIQAVNTDREGTLEILELIEGESLSAVITARLDQDLANFFDTSLDVELAGEVRGASHCENMSQALKSGQ